MFLRGRSRTDVGKEIIEELGFHQMLWNAKKDAIHVHLTCGGYSPWGGPNSCLFRPLWPSAVWERLVRSPVLAEPRSIVSSRSTTARRRSGS